MKINPLRIAGALLLLVVGAGILALIAREHNAGARDFIEYWSSGQLLRHGADPYDPAAILSLERSAGFTRDEALILRNPPTALFLTLPLGYVSPNLGSILWMLMLLACAVLSVHLIWQLNGRPASRTHLLSYCFAPLMECLMAGQVGTILLLGVALFLTLLPRRPFWAGAALVLCAAKPHLFVPFGIVLLLWIASRRAWPVLAGAVSALAASAALITLVDPHIWTQYRAFLHSAGIMQQVVPTLSAVFRQLIHRDAVWLQFVPEAAAILWALWYYARRRAQWSWMREGLLLLLVSLLCSPYSFFTDEALLLPAVITAAYRAEDSGRSLLPFGIAAVLAMLEVLLQVPINTINYVWTAPAWLAWFLYATRDNQAPAEAAS